MPIIIGLGPGRAGTASLAQLLNQQVGALVTHECNPACLAVEGTPAPIVTMIREFQAILGGAPSSALTVDLSRPAIQRYFDGTKRRINAIGDVAFYHLNYVELINELAPDTCFLCMDREPEEVVRSFLQKTAIGRTRRDVLADRIASLISGRPYHTARNHWSEHDGSIWRKDPVWDKLFPKFDTDNRETAIRLYVDWYYQRAWRLADKMSSFHMVPIDMLNRAEGQRSILKIAGIEGGICSIVHENSSGSS